jgi:hypothetical protein
LIGRESQGAQAWTNYWFNARNRLQFNYRHQKVSQGFVPGGGTVTDVGVRGDHWFRSSFGVSASVQYERWAFPVIQPGQQTNVSATVAFLFQPQKLFRQTSANADLGDGGRPMIYTSGASSRRPAPELPQAVAGFRDFCVPVTFRSED